jgi:cytochrome P450
MLMPVEPARQVLHDWNPPIHGLKALMIALRFVSDPIPVMRLLYRERGPVIAFGKINRLARKERLLVMAFGPDYNQQILSAPNVFRSRGMMLEGPEGSAHRRIRFGLISMNAEQHLRHRKLAMPPFHIRSVEGYRNAIVELTTQMLDSWTDGERRDIWDDMQTLALHTASTILFGASDPAESYRIGHMIDEWLTMCFSRPVWFFQVNIPGTPYRRLLRRAERLEAHIRAMVDRKRRDGSDVLSVMLRARDEGAITDDELIGQVNVLFTAAHETNKTALTWTLFLLSQHPRVMADLLDELDGELDGEAPRVDQFDRLPLLERVIKESLRILPPVIWSTRIVDQPVQLGSYDLPKGSRVIYSQYMTHHLPELYPNPERFDPDRWRSHEPTPYTYLPFGAGPRMCIGYAFSMTFLRISLAMILQRYRLSLWPGARIDRKYAVTMSPKYGMPMTVHHQDRQFTREIPCGSIHDMVDLRAD